MTFPRVTLAAPAKLNLYLHVTGKRADGYNLLDSLVVFTDISDTLTLTPAPSLVFTADGPFAGDFGDGDPTTNLVVRAARTTRLVAGSSSPKPPAKGPAALKVSDGAGLKVSGS